MTEAKFMRKSQVQKGTFFESGALFSYFLSSYIVHTGAAAVTNAAPTAVATTSKNANAVPE